MRNNKHNSSISMIDDSPFHSSASIWSKAMLTNSGSSYEVSIMPLTAGLSYPLWRLLHS